MTGTRAGAVLRAGLRSGILFALLVATAAQAQDFDEYTRLLGQAEAAHDALDQATPEQLSARRESALTCDLAVIGWLDAFLASESFAAMPADAQVLARQDRYRNEFNASQILIDMDRCGEARDRIRTLLDSPIDDAELRPLLTESYERALACLARPRVARLRVDTTPTDAELVVDGQVLGFAYAQHDVELGRHTLVVRAPGHASEELAFEATTEGEEIGLGPIALVALEETSAGKSPNALEWALWGVVGAAITTGVILLLSGLDLQSQIDAIDPNDPTADQPEPTEEDRASTYVMVGAIVGGVGLASALTGTILYVTRDATPSRDETSPPGSGAPAPQTTVGLTFRF